MTFVMAYALRIYDLGKAVLLHKGIRRESMRGVGRSVIFFQLKSVYLNLYSMLCKYSHRPYL